jgi:predicted nucleic acid-binding protein
VGAHVPGVTCPVLLDNTVLTNLALVGRGDLVSHLWPKKACTTLSVLEEYRAGAASGLFSPDTWSELSVAVHRKGLFATDDLDARRVAREHGVPRTGTLGILVLCVQQGHLVRDQANALLAEMIALGYRSPVESLTPLLDEKCQVSKGATRQAGRSIQPPNYRTTQPPSLPAFQPSTKDSAQ